MNDMNDNSTNNPEGDKNNGSYHSSSNNKSSYSNTTGSGHRSQVNYEEVLNTAAAFALHHNHHSSQRRGNSQFDPPSPSPKENQRNDFCLNNMNCNENDLNSRENNGNNYIRQNNGASPSSSSPRNFSWIKQNILLSASAEESAKLSSLPQRPIANFPDEADRKRIIGCLAAILSMMFDHELQGCLNYKSFSSKDLVNTNNNSTNNNDDNNSNVRSDENDGTTSRIQLESSIFVQDPPTSTTNSNYVEDNANTSRESVTLIDDSSSIEAQPLDYDDFESMDENSKILNQSNDSTCSLSSTKSSSGIRRGRSKNNQISNITTNNNNSSSNSSTSSKSILNINKNAPPKKYKTVNKKVYYRPSALVEQQIYRRRRHEVYSSLLVFAAELLLLDKSNAVAFLPLLNSMLGEDKPIFSGVDSGAKKRTVITVHRSPRSSAVPAATNGAGNIGKVSSNSNSEQSDVSEGSRLLRGWNNSSIDTSQSSGNLKYNNYDHDHDHSVEYETMIGGGNKDGKLKQSWDNNDLLSPFVESLTPGAGFQCLALLLTNYLLRSQVGYDARVRHIFKKLGLVLICHEMKLSNEYEDKNDDYLARLATRKFEALEDAVALKLLRLSAAQEHNATVQNDKLHLQDDATKKSKAMQKIVRGLKVGSAGIAAGTLFAVTGGLAAPGIAAGLAASGLTFTAATASIVTTLTSTAAVTTIFGLGGGSLAAYKTHRRVKGITEFNLTKEVRRIASKDDNRVIDGNLFSVICVSGWLNDQHDFQRPWGVEPTNPPITDLAEKLKRFYTLYNPEVIPRINDILKRWKGEERNLWMVLRQKYGRDPDQIYPLESGYQRSPISYLESEIIDNLLTELGYAIHEEKAPDVQKPHRFGMFKSKIKSRKESKYDDSLSTVPHAPVMNTSINNNHLSNNFYNNKGEEESKDHFNKPFHDMWDYKGEYGGEMLTLRWESDLLMELCDSVTDMAVDMVGTAAKEILKQTALSTLITAIAWPYGLVRAANMIDGTWTLAIERADLAGIELARRLLESKAGHRPVVLVGFSMGARAIYSCLKELARHQLLWEEKRKTEKNNAEFMAQREPASIIEDAIMLGLPNHLSVHAWMSCRSVVAGRLVNCYSGRDLILSLMFQIKRLSGALKPVCGCSPVNVPGVENYDVSNFISGHSDYCKKTGHILRMIYHGCPYRPTVTITIPREFISNPAI